jgi:hypothetical protein
LHLAPHALNILISPHNYSYMLDHAEPESEVQVEHAQAEEITNLVGSRQALVHHTIILNFYFELISLY